MKEKVWLVFLFVFGLFSSYSQAALNEYTLKLSRNISHGTVSPASKTVKAGSKVTITAVPDEGYGFREWYFSTTGRDCTIADKKSMTTTVTVKEDCNVAANFAAIRKLTLSATTGGKATSSATSVLSGDPITLTATPSANYRFDGWTGTSNYCKLSSTTSKTTTLNLTGDCNIKANFSKIMVKLTMSAETGGTVTPATNEVWEGSSVDINAVPQTGYRLKQWSTSNSTSCRLGSSSSASTTVTVLDACTVTAQFETRQKLTVTSDPGGRIVDDPSGMVWPRTTFNISAKGDRTHTFQSWIVESGSKCSLSSSSTYNTRVTMGDGPCNIRARYANSGESRLYQVTGSYRTMDFSKMRYGDDPMEIRMYTVTTDTSWYYLEFSGNLTKYPVSYGNYGSDRTFTTKDTLPTFYSTVISSSSSSSLYRVFFKGTVGEHYWTAGSGFEKINGRTGTPTFQVRLNRVASASVTVNASAGGFTNPSGEVSMPVGGKMVLEAFPQPGYVFDAWTKRGSNCTLDDARSSTTVLNVTNGGSCTCTANFVQDRNFVPDLKVERIDESHLPQICADVSVTNKKNSSAVLDLSSSDFKLNLNGKEVSTEFATVKNVQENAVSIVLVVDESASMSGKRLEDAKKSIKNFVMGMRDYDQTAIVSFRGYGVTVVHQELTSNKADLLLVADRLSAVGPSTNICDGTKRGLEQLEGISGTTAVIVFSDGANLSDSTKTKDVISIARELDTRIYSIAVATSNAPELQEMAKGTGGDFKPVSNAAALEKIYDDIRSSIKKQVYTLCFDPPDGILNGDEYKIDISTTIGGMTGGNTVNWTEPQWRDLDEVDYVSIVDAKNGGEVLRNTEGMNITVQTQNFADDCNDPYTEIPVTVSCLVSGDEETVLLSHFGKGIYDFMDYKKREGIAVVGNDILECSSRDTLVVEYTDPVYKTVTRTTVELEDKIAESILLVAQEAPQDSDVDSVATSISTEFKISVHAVSPSLYEVDTLYVFMETSAGASIVTKVVETGAYTSEFVGYETFYILNGSASEENYPFAGIIDVSQPVNEFLITAFMESPLSGSELSAQYRVVSEYVPSVLSIYNGDEKKESENISRTTENIRISLNAMDETHQIDFAKILLKCVDSGDEEILNLEEKDGDSPEGFRKYEMAAPIAKNEGAAIPGDGVLSCSNRDVIYAEYLTPIYQKVASVSVEIGDDVENTYQFLVADKSADLDSVETAISADYGLRITTESPSIYVVDTIPVVLFTDQGDSIIVSAVETGAYTSVFEYVGTIYVANQKDRMEKGRLECLLDKDSVFNRVKVSAWIEGSASGVSDSLIVFSTFAASEVAIRNAEDETAGITRTTEKVRVSVVAMDESNGIDTVDVVIGCKNSEDFEIVKLVEQDVESSEKMKHYEMLFDLPKNELRPRQDDKALSCSPSDTIVAKFRSAFFNTVTETSVSFADQVEFSYQFLKEDGVLDLDSLESYSAEFVLRVTAVSPRLYDVDTIQVTLFTDQGDSLKIDVVETDSYSSEFEGRGSFNFVTDSSLVAKNVLDAVLNRKSDYNRIAIRGQMDGDGSALNTRDSLVVFAYFVAADSAEILDKNLDGQADFVRVHFAKPVNQETFSIDTVRWNGFFGSWRGVSDENIRVVDDYWMEASLDSSFEYALTSIDDSAHTYIKFSRSSSVVVERIALTDKVGAVPAKATKHPGAIDSEEYLDGGTTVPPDTLVVEMSEIIRNVGEESSWKDLFLFGSSCDDPAPHKLHIDMKPEVDESGLVWTIVIPRYEDLRAGGCLMMNKAAPYEDLAGNSLGIGGVEIDGDDGDVYLYEIKANPAVSGLDEKAIWINPETHGWEDVPEDLSTIIVQTKLAYVARAIIYDNEAHVVATLRQEFGKNGEMEDPIRENKENATKIGFLQWDQRTDEGLLAATGVYIWKIQFVFEDGHKEIRTIKSGIRRHDR